MIVRLAAAAVALLTIVGNGSAQSAPAGTLVLTTESKLWVEGTSTVKAYKCTAKTVDATILTGAEGSAAPIGTLVSSATVSVKTAELDCKNNTMNEHMRKALKLEANPRIEFKLDSYQISGGTAELKGQLQIAGKTNAITFPATVTEEGGVVRVKATKLINMKEWGIKPPSLMMGTMKVKEPVTISFDLTFKR